MLKGSAHIGLEALGASVGVPHAEADPVGVHIVVFKPVLCGQSQNQKQKLRISGYWY